MISEWGVTPCYEVTLLLESPGLSYFFCSYFDSPPQVIEQSLFLFYKISCLQKNCGTANNCFHVNALGFSCLLRTNTLSAAVADRGNGFATNYHYVRSTTEELEGGGDRIHNLLLLHPLPLPPFFDCQGRKKPAASVRSPPPSSPKEYNRSAALSCTHIYSLSGLDRPPAYGRTDRFHPLTHTHAHQTTTLFELCLGCCFSASCSVTFGDGKRGDELEGGEEEGLRAQFGRGAKTPSPLFPPLRFPLTALPPSPLLSVGGWVGGSIGPLFCARPRPGEGGKQDGRGKRRRGAFCCQTDFFERSG